MGKEWFTIDFNSKLDSPCLVIYPDRVKKNIEIFKSMVRDPLMLRPHIKTHKCKEVIRLCLEAGIQKYKCATISEAEILGLEGASDVLLAYQPQGPKQDRFLNLKRRYPQTKFSCLLDNPGTGLELSSKARDLSIEVDWFMDLNIGMNRTGIPPNSDALSLYLELVKLPGLRARGFHAYDGHLQDSDILIRKEKCDRSFLEVEMLSKNLKSRGQTITIIAGGTTTFPIHAERGNVECSPGTFIYWDYGYKTNFPEQKFLTAAVLITRVISQIDKNTYCLDLGHKSVASEKPLDQRIHFLNLPLTKFISQSEEHLVIQVEGQNSLQIGDIIYGLPYHICPTVALFEEVQIIDHHEWVGSWKNLARNRKISI